MSYDALKEAVIKGDVNTATAQTRQAVEAGDNPKEILDTGLVAAMDIVGEQFSSGRIFVPQMLRSAKTMQQCVEILKPHFQEGECGGMGKIVLGTVKGDLHDIGKNLVAMMLEGAGFQIIDLGVDVSPEAFVQKVKEEDAKILGMSALLSTTMPGMATTIQALLDAGMRDAVKVMIGGAPVTSKYAEEIGADSYSPDAGTAALEAKKIFSVA